jgi:hypothetical protein
MTTKFTHEQKKKLARKIEKVKSKQDILKIYKLISSEDARYNENSNGIFMFFHKLSDATYNKLDQFLYKTNKTHHYYKDSVNEKCLSESFLSADDATDQDLNSNSVVQTTNSKLKLDNNADENNVENHTENIERNSKLKFSNKEKNLIKRKIYDKAITEVDTDIIYCKFESQSNSPDDSPILNEVQKENIAYRPKINKSNKSNKAPKVI